MPSSVSFFASLRTRSMLLACGLVLLFSVCWGSWTWMHERQMLQQRLEDAGSVLVSSMSIPIINALLYEELGLVAEGGLIDNFIIDIMDNPQLKPVYAQVTDTSGKIIAHSEIGRYGEQADDEQTGCALQAERVILQKLKWHGQQVLDVGTPLAIHGKRWGCLRIGLPLAPLQQQLQALALRIFSFSLLFSCGALLLFFLVGGYLVRPLRELTRAMERVSGEQLDSLPESRRRDEIGLLQNSFRRMLSRLRSSERERDESVKLLLENERLVTAGRIVAGVAHEINNPLAGISGALTLLRKKPQELDNYLPLLQNEVERITGIVKQLLDLSRAGELSKQPMISQELLANIGRICTLALKGRQIVFRAAATVPEVVLQCDPQKVAQVVLNLVINAADATGPGGEIRLRSILTEQHFCLQVADNGPGVPPHLREKIFTPFFTTKAAGKGTGIGLSFCRSTIERHGGTLQLLETETGACFEIRLPLEG